MFNIPDAKAEAQKFSEGSSLLPEGWLTGTIINVAEKSFSSFTAIVVDFDNGANVLLNFNGPEQWKIDKATQMLSLIIVSIGIEGNFTPDRLPELIGRQVDMKNTHKSSKKLDANNVPYVNNNIINIATAGSRTGNGAAPLTVNVVPTPAAPVPTPVAPVAAAQVKKLPWE